MTQKLGIRGVAAVAFLLLSFVGGSTAAAAKAQDMTRTTQSAALLVETPTVSSLPAGSLIQTQSQLPKVQALLRATLNGETIAPPPFTPLPPRAGPVVVMQGSPSSLLYDGVIGSASDQSLAAMVESTFADDLDEEANCLATAVYFESKGEPLVGQLAVAQVVINRARSGRFPPTLCGVVKQHAQFSFVRGGAFPHVDAGCNAWRRARAIARIAQNSLMASLPSDVLWYHADYVAPRWRQAMIKVEKIGAHIFYRA